MRSRSRRALRALALLAGLGLVYGAAARSLVPERVTSINWTMPDDPGGWSGLEVSASGDQIWLVGDDGDWAEGRLSRAPDSRLEDVTITASGRLRRPNGTPLRPPWQDVEGLALGPDGTFYISREWQHGIDRLPALSKRPTALPRAAEFFSMRFNTGPEALAIDSDGTLYTAQERPGLTATTTPLFRLPPGGDRWDTDIVLPRDHRWSISGADFGPDGALYILERRFVVIGFMTRVRRIELHVSPIRVTTEYRSAPGRHGNLEGLAIWKGPDGHLRALMVSDNNQMPFQRQEMVEVILAPLASEPPDA